MPEVPGPPTEYDEQQREAWLEGAATVARIMADQNAVIAGVYRKHADEDGKECPESAEESGDDEDADTCDDCGGQLLDAMGGPVCPNCN